MILGDLVKFLARGLKRLIVRVMPTSFFLLSILNANTFGQNSTKPKPEITGFFKNLLSVTDVRDSFQNLNLTNQDFAVDNFQRLRLKVDYTPFKNTDIRIHYELRSVWGETVRIQSKLKDQSTANLSGINTLIKPTSRRRFLDLESELERESNFVLEHSLDRIRLRYQTDELEFNLGRQAISWGTGLIWNPTDLFSGFAPTEIDRDEKNGYRW